MSIDSESLRYSCVGDYYTHVALSTCVEPSRYLLPMSSESQLFSSWLKQQIDSRFPSAAEFARRAGTSTANVARWTRTSGKQVIPDPDSCVLIAKALNLAPDYVLYLAGHLPEPAVAPSEYERLRAIEEAVSHLRIVGPAAPGREVSVRFYGRVPADSVRWVSSEQSGDTVPVMTDWLQGAHHSQFLVVEASGSCLQTQGIVDGSRVLIRRSLDDVPQNGTISLVRFGEEFTLKIWNREGEWITLTDGNAQVIHRFSIVDDFEVVGVFVASWKLA